jgi:hypothetical protein
MEQGLMDAESKKSLDNSVKQMQIGIFSSRCKFGGLSEKDRAYMLGYIMSIDLLNRNFKTDYLTHELVNMKLTDKDNCVCDFMPYLPLHKGQENIFSGK